MTRCRPAVFLAAEIPAAPVAFANRRVVRNDDIDVSLPFAPHVASVRGEII